MRTLDVDPFSDEVLTDPWPAYRALRDAGPAVRLAGYDTWAIGRHADVRTALLDHATFSSAEGVGYEPVLNENTRGTVLASDPPEHDRLRAVLTDQLAPRALRGLRERITQQADELVAGLVGRGSFDAVRDLAEPFPVSVIADLIGLPAEARDPLLEFADAGFNTFGPMNARTQQALPAVGKLFGYLAEIMVPGNLHPDGWAAATWAAADRGEIDHASVVPLLSSYLVASMDTTINGIGNTVALLCEHPEALAELRADPTLLAPAFEESLRVDSPVSGFFRTTTSDADVDGTTIPAGQRVLLLYASANRDERAFPDPDVFDVRRRPTTHVAFGYGTHVCVGQALARMEAKALLGALVSRTSTLTFDGDPVRRLNNVVRGYGALPVRVTG